jgi:hypothetical protein
MIDETIFGNDRFQICLTHAMVNRLISNKSEHMPPAWVGPLSPPQKMEAIMSKSDVNKAIKRAERQVENTSAGGHLGGAYYGQCADGKTASTNNNVGSNRPNAGN